MSTATVPRLKAAYNDELRDALQEHLGLDNVMQVPRLEKVVLNMGVGEAVGDSKKVQAAASDLAATREQDQAAQQQQVVEVEIRYLLLTYHQLKPMTITLRLASGQTQ